MIKLKNLNKKTIIIISIIILIVCIVCIVCIVYYTREHFIDTPISTSTSTSTYNFESNIELLENVKNPYIKINTIPTSNNSNCSQEIIWQKLDSKFMKSNWPNTFDFDYSIKEDIINKALKLPLNMCIIDCGAHIGDGSIAIAHALKYYNREDITVYAIDPSKYKCDFIEFIKNQNNLTNIIVLNYGLSNVNNKYKSLPPNQNDIINTGGWEWSTNINSTDNIDDKNIINTFIKLDDLVKNNIIKHSIGIIHLDVEGMEKEAILGGIDTITKYKPYMSIENNHKSGKDTNENENSKNNEYFMEFLPKGYKYNYNKNDNNILTVE